MNSSNYLNSYAFSGDDNVADAAAASVGGKGNVAHTFAQTVIGRYANTGSSGDKTGASLNDSDVLFIVGGGTGPSARKNAMLVTAGGDLYLGYQATNAGAIHAARWYAGHVLAQNGKYVAFTYDLGAESATYAFDVMGGAFTVNHLFSDLGASNGYSISAYVNNINITLDQSTANPVEFTVGFSEDQLFSLNNTYLRLDNLILSTYFNTGFAGGNFPIGAVALLPASHTLASTEYSPSLVWWATNSAGRSSTVDIYVGVDSDQAWVDYRVGSSAAASIEHRWSMGIRPSGNLLTAMNLSWDSSAERAYLDVYGNVEAGAFVLDGSHTEVAIFNKAYIHTGIGIHANAISFYCAYDGSSVSVGSITYDQAYFSTSSFRFEAQAAEEGFSGADVIITAQSAGMGISDYSELYGGNLYLRAGHGVQQATQVGYGGNIYLIPGNPDPEFNGNPGSTWIEGVVYIGYDPSGTADMSGALAVWGTIQGAGIIALSYVSAPYVQAQSGSVSAPSFRFNASTNTGLFLTTSPTLINFAVGATNYGTIGNSLWSPAYDIQLPTTRQFRAYAEDRQDVKFATYWSSISNQYGMGQLQNALSFVALDANSARSFKWFVDRPSSVAGTNFVAQLMSGYFDHVAQIRTELYTFRDNTSIYWHYDSGAGKLEFINGSYWIVWWNASSYWDTNLTFLAPQFRYSGSTTDLAFTSHTDTDTGIGFPAANSMSMMLGNTRYVQWDTTCESFRVGYALGFHDTSRTYFVNALWASKVDANGANLVISPGDNTIIGSGEAGSTLVANFGGIQNNAEKLVFGSDVDIYFFYDMNTWGSSKYIWINSTGSIIHGTGGSSTYPALAVASNTDLGIYFSSTVIYMTGDGSTRMALAATSAQTWGGSYYFYQPSGGGTTTFYIQNLATSTGDDYPLVQNSSNYNVYRKTNGFHGTFNFTDYYGTQMMIQVSRGIITYAGEI